MTNNTLVTALPIGEFDTELVRAEFDAIVQAFALLGVDILVVDPVADEAGVRQAVEVLSARNSDLLLIIPLRGLSAQVMELAVRMGQRPGLIWPVQGRFALPSSTLAMGALRESGAPVELIYAPPDHPMAIEKIQGIVKAAKAYARIRQSRIGVIGGLFPNLVACRYDPQKLSARLGVTLLPIEFEELRERIQGTSRDSKTIAQAIQATTNSYAVDATDMKSLEAGIKLHLALKLIVQEQHLDGLATECWTGFPREIGLNPCLGFSEDAYTLACEGDVMLCVSLLMVQHLTGAKAYVSDVYDLDLEGSLTLVHCGAPCSLASNKSEVVLAKSALALERGFETITCRPQLETGPVTLFRFYGWECNKLHMAMGELTSCQQAPNLTVKVQVKGNRWDFLEQCMGNHYVVAAADIRQELKLLAKWLGITVFET